MRKKRGGEKPLDALLATTEDKEHQCVIKTVSSGDSFVLIGSSESVVKKTGQNGRLTSIVIKTPNQGEKGLVGVVLRRELEDTFCRCCESQVIQQTILYISVACDRNGKPKTQISEEWNVPLVGVKFSVEDGSFVDLIAPFGKFTTNFRKAYDSGKEHVWYVPARKMFSFLVRQSVEFLLEAAKCAYFERLALRRDDMLQVLMEDIFEYEESLDKLEAHARDLEHQLARVQSSAENYRNRLNVAEGELVVLEDELTAICRDRDADRILEQDDDSQNAQLRKRIRELEYMVEDAADYKEDVENITRALGGLLTRKGKGALHEGLIEVVMDFPGFFKIDEECA